MKTPQTASLPPIPATTLLADYERWLAFVSASRQTIRHYDRQLAHIGERYPELSALSNYLRGRMHYRAQFFGRLAIHLTATVAQLRTERSDAALLQQLTYTHQAMQQLVDELETAFIDIQASYRTLLPTAETGVSAVPWAPAYRSNRPGRN